MSAGRRAAALVAFAIAFAAAPVRAARPLDERPFRALDAPFAAGATIVLEPVVLDDGTAVVLELARIEPFARDARIVVHAPAGDTLAPLPSDRWFTGRVVGDAESFAMIARGTSTRGFIAAGGRVATIGPERDVAGGGPPGRTVVTSFDPVLDMPGAVRAFTCDTDTLPTPPEALAPPAGRRALSSVMYFAGIAVETDYELYVKKGSSASALTQYVGDLFAAVSAIYQRDILVTLQVNYLSIWPTASDPWAATTSSGALGEFVSYWGTNRAAVPRSLAHMLSGKGTGGGVAYLNVLCSGFSGYGFSGSLSGTAPANLTTTYWDFLCVSHEIGHNFGSPHTHCYTPVVDSCCTCATEGACGSGTGAGPVPPEKGTIMSYCHQRPGGYSNIKMFLGVPAETSAAVLTRMRNYVESSAACFGTVAGPSVIGVVPTSGPTLGGTPVTITGTGFTSPATVKIRGSAASSVVVVNATTITAVTPAGAAGAADVSVIVTGNQGGTLVAAYAYSSAGAPPPPPPVSAATGFNPVAPCRLLDTRNPAGPLGAPAIGGGGLRAFVAAGACNVPAGAIAISANVTIVNPTAAGDFLVYPNGLASPPSASTLNFRAGRTRANNSFVYLASDGSFLVRNGASGAVDVLVDVNGYYK